MCCVTRGREGGEGRGGRVGGRAQWYVIITFDVRGHPDIRTHK